MRATDAPQEEKEMATRDILNLDNALAPRLIRCLYTAALILITVMVVLGVVRGVRIMSLPPLPPAAIADAAAPGMAMPALPPGMAERLGDRRMMGERRFDRRDFGGRRRFAPFGLGRNPVIAGLFVIFGTLLRGAIILMVVRILAELGIAVLAMPRRSEP
jgi:hypothetical protein